MTLTKKQVINYTRLAILFSFIFIMFLPIGHAAGAIADFPEAMLDQINHGVINTIRKNLTSDNGNNKFYAYMVSATPINGTTSAITLLSNATKALSGFMILILAVTRYFQSLDKGKDPVEGIYEMFTEIFLVAFFMINVDKIMEWIVSLGEWFIDIVTSIAENPAITPLTLLHLTGKDEGGAMWFIQTVLILIVPWILTLVMEIVAQFISFSLLIELGIRKAFAPFAVCDIYGEGMRSPGMRYLKRYLSAFLKIAICLFVCYLGEVLMGLSLSDNIANFNSMTDILQYVFRIIAINFTVLGVMAKAGEYANDITGVSL